MLALEMNADLDDVALTMHPHPSLSETVMQAAEAGLGSITDLYLPKKS
jgi:dihydrolipoamide dehydrogenase